MEITFLITTGVILYSTYKMNKKIKVLENEIKMVWNRTEGKKWDL